MRVITGLGVLGIGLVGCGGAQLPSTADPLGEAVRIVSGVQGSPEVIGCGDVHIVVYGSADHHALIATIHGDLAAGATTAGQPVLRQLPLPDADVDLRVVWGDHVSEPECNDVPSGATVIRGEALPISGNLELEVIPDGYGTVDFPTGHATLLLEDVVFEDPITGVQRTLQQLEAADVSIGWLPG